MERRYISAGPHGLTPHLHDLQSPIRQFFDKQFKNTPLVVREFNRDLRGSETIRPAGKVPYFTLGTALDYRLRYYFAVTPCEELLAIQGANMVSDAPIISREVHHGRDSVISVIHRLITGNSAFGEEDFLWRKSPAIVSLPAEITRSFFHSLDEVLQQLRPAGRRLERSQEEQLARYCVVLALFDQVFRAGPNPDSPLFLSGRKTTVSGLLSIAPAAWVDDLCAVSWLFYDRCSAMLAQPVHLNPTFDGSGDVGGADADLILDRCLIDIKSTIHPKVTNIWLYQLLGYALLDYSDQYQIRELGFYLARQGKSLRWPVPQLVDHLVYGVAPPVEKLRERFQQIVRSTRN